MPDWSTLNPIERSAAMTLLWRAADSSSGRGMLSDAVAEQVAGALPPWPSSVSSREFAAIATVRTWQMDAEVAAALAEGLSQVVVLGAGLDTRFWRMPPPSSARIIEVDSEPVNEFARRLLPNGGQGHRVDARIPDGLERALSRAAHNPRQPTLWIAEGILEYLPGRLWDRLIRILTEQSAPRSMALITVLGESLPKRFAHDPTFPFLRLPSTSRIVSTIPDAWKVQVLSAPLLRGVLPEAYCILSLRLGRPAPE